MDILLGEERSLPLSFLFFLCIFCPKRTTLKKVVVGWGGGGGGEEGGRRRGGRKVEKEK